MAISRPLLFTLIGAVALLAVVMAVRVIGPGTESGSDSSSAVQQRATASQPGAQAASQAAPAGTSQARAGATNGKGASSGRAKGSDPSGEGVPAQVGRALAEHKVVVLFFGAQGSDDKLTRDAARSVESSGAAVFTDSVYHLEDYARVVGALPVSQVPATIVIDPQRRARVIDGFVDAGSLRQLVDDAR